ncbi:stage III sporulation protein AF [Bacillus solimangrovi]|uniref:Stage III sporulation protein AF n=1 Tax=Bacillus solimangrovi TaxID=1305675 RepID=A0A1E5LK83_9BACI|nr:stage III sporulation protein AF [Bacillus solimangrovi]OEH94485.1 stage III sporulation protein AF [Bacillus solimangrovi]
MEYIATWITNIVLFILLAMVVDMLLPNSAMQNYAKMVIGLLLILLILTPILRIFSEDFEEILRTMEIGNSVQSEQLKNRLELKKKEIQANQRAYILEETAVQMKENVQKELVERYGYSITNINLKLENDVGENWTTVDLQSLQVSISQLSDEKENVESIDTVEPIQIDVSEIKADQEEVKSNSGDYNELRAFLALKWGVDENKISIIEN